jgi:N-acetylglutamate synthase-like GNAT family acetyltransferase
MDLNPHIVLRPAQPADADRLTAIARAAKAHWGYPAAWLEGWREELTVTATAIEVGRFLIAELAGEPVGFVALGDEDGVPEIEHLWVTPEAMGRGVGSRLLAATLAECRAVGVTRVRVVSDPHAAGFYRSRGARPVGEVPSTPSPRRLPLLEFLLGETAP